MLSEPHHMDTMPACDLRCFSRQSLSPRVKSLTSRQECGLLMLPNHQSLDRWACLIAHKDGVSGIGLSPGLTVTMFDTRALKCSQMEATWLLVWEWQLGPSFQCLSSFKECFVSRFMTRWLILFWHVCVLSWELSVVLEQLTGSRLELLESALRGFWFLSSWFCLWF